MKRLSRYYLTALAITITLTSCTITEDVQTQVVRCPENTDTVTVDPWEDPGQGNQHIGH